MNSLSSFGQSLDQLPSLEEINAEIRRRETKRNADAIRQAQAKRGGFIEFVRYFWPSSSRRPNWSTGGHWTRFASTLRR
jgi:hypothetical protein